ncbi:hypothetical protein [Bacteroides sp. 519]|uniref:hypothetical protein n=1 Tax=Bacteroides sp. 519 TaxID=2302937 RepID=UPI0013CF825B|nr:hypothetical protein [Bacteroides sp. 519]NDV60225.1 hypothetical protein [Bacteroides sp. 519]
MQKKYSIAGLTVVLTGGKTLLKVAELPGFTQFEIEGQSKTPPDILINMDKDVDAAYLTNIQPIHSFYVSDIEHFFIKCKEGYLYEMYKPNGDKIVSIIYDHNGNATMSAVNSEMYLKYILWVAFSLPAAGKNVLSIHASSIVNNAGTILFLGESGTGKSTHTRLWLQYIKNSYLLNDDSPLLRIENGKMQVYGSPWSGKTHCYQAQTVPLKAIVRLSQYPDNKVSRLNKLGSIGAIYPSFPPFLAYDETFSGKMIDVLDKIIEDTPVYELKCRPDKQAAEVVHAAIYQGL